MGAPDQTPWDDQAGGRHGHYGDDQLSEALEKAACHEHDGVDPIAVAGGVYSDGGRHLPRPVITPATQWDVPVIDRGLAADETAPIRVSRTPTWSGRLEPYVVGIPGAAATYGRSRVDPAMPYRADTVLDGAEVLGVSGRVAARFRAASVRGLSHRQHGKTRQDDYAVRQTADRRHLVAVVADGVSAGEHSHRAAAQVTQRGADLLAGWLAEGSAVELPWSTLVQQLSEEVAILGRRLWERGHTTEPTDGEIAGTLATTALFAVVELVDDGPLPLHLFPIGDSSAWILRGGRYWEPQQPVKNAGLEIASASTAALPGVRSAGDPPIRTVLDSTDVLALVTDGVGDPLQDGDNDFGDYLRDQWATTPSPLAFAAQVDFARKSFDDDRTAVAVWAGAG